MLTVRRLPLRFLCVSKSPLRVQSTAISRYFFAVSRPDYIQGHPFQTMNAPYVAQNPSEISDLVHRLNGSSQKSGGGKHALRCKKHAYDVHGTPYSVDSWQYRDWDYKRRDLPTYARGLFTYRTKNGNQEIAARGYDKFFNVGEVQETEWDNVQAYTQGPYELSVKENGCIIFISGIEGDHLLVCSKHSTGARENLDLSHAVAGERWVDRHLATVGKDRSALARELRKRNVTAVAELCDDDFEEHVLAYEPKDAGLYLHGLNLNLPDFATYPGELVHRFADEWGFRKAQYLVQDDLPSMKSFLEECAETGSYDGRDTEGFVIRCTRLTPGTKNEFHNWFFKYKFEEPYLMYRQWRECTKAIIAGKPPKYKKHKRITEEYLLYARRQLGANVNLGKEYNKNHGIIAMRDGFLNERGLKGADIIRQEEEEGSDSVKRDLVLLPIATLGCGKTTVANALTKLFDWGHVQNDNITGKRGRPQQFTSQICAKLATHQACIGDRNNHQKRERKQIINDVLSFLPDAKFVALHYVHHPKSQMLPHIQEVTRERIFSRGDNHQTIQAGSKSRQEIVGIMDGFLDRFEPFDASSDPDEHFDSVVDLDVAASSRENLETIINHLYQHYPEIVKSIPSSTDMDQAIDSTLNGYKPDIKHDLSFKSSKDNRNKSGPSHTQPQNGAVPRAPKPPKLEYFCVRIEPAIITSLLSKIFNQAPPETAKMYNYLLHSRRIQQSFHVTLMHRASINQNAELWQHLATLHADAVNQAASAGNPTFEPTLGKCRVRLEKVVWDDRVMAIVARLLDAGWESVNEVQHVTVGTANESIKPKESNDLLKRWLDERGGVQVWDVSEVLEVPGEVRAVLSKN